MMAGMNAHPPKSLHVFKPGRHTAMQGNTVDFSEFQLAACAAAYDPELHEAPLVIGHPKTTAPAYGWVQSLKVDGNGLHAVPRQVNADFAEMVQSGAFKKISASFYLPDAPNNPVPGTLYLRHVGFLGAQPPAIKGLAPVEFAEGEAGIVEFADWDDVQNASLWRSLRDWLIGQFGQDAADKAIPGYGVASLEDAARTETDHTDITQPAFAEPKETPMTDAEKQELDALKAENARLRTAQAANVAAARHAKNVDFAEKLVSEGRLAPAAREVIVATLDFADTPPDAMPRGIVEFGEGDDKKPLGQALRDTFAALPKIVEFAEVATKGKADANASKEINPLIADAEARAKR